jgi:DNA-binding transcriptional MerR regulator
MCCVAYTSVSGCRRATQSFMQKHKQAVQRGAPTAIPDKLYFRIGEVAKLCKVQAYVLRFWESEFPQLKPNKSGTGQRLYRKRDVEMAMQIKHLLHDEGYTIAGARQLLHSEAREPRRSRGSQPELPLRAEIAKSKNEARLQKLRKELKELLGMLSVSPAAAPRERKPKSKMPAERPSLFGE